MIGLRLEDQSFEQDIRELLMAFFPGELFDHEEDKEISYRLLFYGKTKDNTFICTIEDRLQGKSKTSSVPLTTKNRLETKNQIKRLIYGMAKELTGNSLPWGTLTGIRPTKIAMTKLIDGESLEKVRRDIKETYLTSDQKVDLTLEIAGREIDLISKFDYKKGYSLYVGIPFCPTTCLYCSFTSYPIRRWESRMSEYLDALEKELSYVSRRMAGTPLHTVYIGGGTPTSLSAMHLERLITHIKETFDFSEVLEFTVEAGRPDSITEEKLKVLKEQGVTRISINPQTMKQETLNIIGRHHTVDMVKEQFYRARNMGFDNINMDLIIGLPEEDLPDIKRTMEEIKCLNPDGITVHSLAIKRAARLRMFREQYENIKITNTQEMIDLTASYAREMGQEPYYLYRQKNMAGNFENVGYSRPFKACIYNILIMEEKQTIVACGAGTSSKILFPKENRLERVENVKDVEQYIARIDEMIERKEKMLAKLEM